MKITEFAAAVGVTDSLLRYYDQKGVLKPVETNLVTGYRYYDESQIAAFGKIMSLKAAGFTLSEIKKIISGKADPEEIQDLFSEKKNRLNEILRLLEDTQKLILGGDFMEINNIELLHEDVNIPFENDEKVVGRWEIAGEAAANVGSRKRELYFLPNGEWYWCYSWTKGKFLYNNGESSRVCDYTLENRGDGLYMVIEFKVCGGIDIITLKKIDGKSYTAEEIARKDNIDMPFVNDERVIGKWKAVGFIENKEDFSADFSDRGFKPYFSSIEFLPNGSCVSVYGGKTISGSDKQVWTKGYVLRKWNKTACGYEIREAYGKEYLIIEWKSGDYRWGGFDTNYYVFVRA